MERKTDPDFDSEFSNWLERSLLDIWKWPKTKEQRVGSHLLLFGKSLNYNLQVNQGGDAAKQGQFPQNNSASSLGHPVLSKCYRDPRPIFTVMAPKFE